MLLVSQYARDVGGLSGNGEIDADKAAPRGLMLRHFLEASEVIDQPVVFAQIHGGGSKIAPD
jgi:hypothetical protein